MVHPIRPQDVTNVYRQQAATTGRAGGPGAGVEGGGAGAQQARRSDRVQISDEAVQLRRVLEQIGDQPELREQRIAELRAQIADGTYDRGLAQVAARLVDEGLVQ